MIKFYFFFFAILTFSSSESQSNNFKDVVVEITLKEKNIRGSGFIYYKKNDTAYILTAAHVLQTHDTSDLKKFKVFVSNQAYVPEIVFVSDSAETNPAFDIALVKVYLPLLNIEPYKIVDDPSECENVYFIRARDKQMLPNGLDGTFEYWKGSNERVYNIHLEDIIPGDSGSLLLCNNQIAGMIIAVEEGYGQVINIHHIQKVIAGILDNNY